MKKILVLFILVFANIFNGYGQMELSQPLKLDIKKNVLFGKHEHYFKVTGKQKIISVSPSIGKTYEITDSSFKYFMNFPISSGKVLFVVKYSENRHERVDTLLYNFVPRTRYSLKVTNYSGEKPSPSELKADSIKFNFFLDNDPISCELLCYVLVNVCKRCDMPAPINCCNGIILSNGKSCLSTLDARKGDRIFFESPVIKYLGKEIKTGASFELKF